MDDILDIYIAFGHRQGAEPLHWILLTVFPGEDKCTWYHATSAPCAQGIQYERKTQTGKRFDSHAIASKQKIGNITVANTGRLLAAVNATPPQMCQRWVVGVLDKLEQDGLLPEGTTATWEAQVENDPNVPATDGNDQSS